MNGNASFYNRAHSLAAHADTEIHKIQKITLLKQTIKAL